MDIDLFKIILLGNNPRESILENEKLIFDMIPSLSLCKGFNQNNKWHIYDVYEHILHVVDGVDNNYAIRLAALFHDVGKPFVYTKDEFGNGHFYKHYEKSCKIFLDFANKYKLDSSLTSTVSKLIYYHDKNISNCTNDELRYIINLFSEKEIKLLYELKTSDLLAQNYEFHYLLDEYNKQQKKLLRYY